MEALTSQPRAAYPSRFMVRATSFVTGKRDLRPLIARASFS
jgi:hypothetical protein